MHHKSSSQQICRNYLAPLGIWIYQHICVTSHHRVSCGQATTKCSLLVLISIVYSQFYLLKVRITVLQPCADSGIQLWPWTHLLAKDFVDSTPRWSLCYCLCAESRVFNRSQWHCIESLCLRRTEGIFASPQPVTGYWITRMARE